MLMMLARRATTLGKMPTSNINGIDVDERFRNEDTVSMADVADRLLSPDRVVAGGSPHHREKKPARSQSDAVGRGGSPRERDREQAATAPRIIVGTKRSAADFAFDLGFAQRPCSTGDHAAFEPYVAIASSAVFSRVATSKADHSRGADAAA